MKARFTEAEHNAWFDRLNKATWQIQDGGSKAVSDLPHLINDAPGQDVEAMAKRFLKAVETMMTELEEIKTEIAYLRKWD